MWLASVLKDEELRDCLEVDLLEKGIDLLDLFRGKVSLRRIMVVMRRLDNDSHLVKEVGQRDIGDAVQWSATDHLLCGVLNTLRYQCYLAEITLYSKSGAKGKKPQLPEAIHPPGHQPAPIRIGTTQELAQMFGG